MTKMTMGPGQVDEAATAALARGDLDAMEWGTLEWAVASAGRYAKKLHRVIHVYQADSWGQTRWWGCYKPAEYLDPKQNVGYRIVSVTPDLVVSWHDLDRGLFPGGLNRRGVMSKMTMGPGRMDEAATRSLARATLRARAGGDLESAVKSAGYYAKKLGQTMYVYAGNSYGHAVWRVSYKPGEYLNPINNTGTNLLSVTPELTVSWHDLNREG